VTTLAAARSILQRLVEAVPDTWRQDRVFRGAVIGAGVTLAVLLVRPGASAPGQAATAAQHAPSRDASHPEPYHAERGTSNPDAARRSAQDRARSSPG